MVLVNELIKLLSQCELDATVYAKNKDGERIEVDLVVAEEERLACLVG